jgi:cold shock CspA family protein
MTNQQLSHPEPPSNDGIIKQWNSARRFGIIFCSGGRRYFLHHSKIVSGNPVLGSRVRFDIGPRRSPVDLESALNVVVGEMVGAQ